MKKRFFTRFLSTCLLAIATPFTALADDTVMVHWGEGTDIVDSFHSLNLNSASLDLATPRNPHFGVRNYYAGGQPEDKSAVFYGTAVNQTGGNARLQMPNAGHIHRNAIVLNFSNGGSGGKAAGMVLWQKGDGFLHGYGAPEVQVPYDQMNLRFKGFLNAKVDATEVRIVVRQGASEFFISNPIGSFDAGTNNFSTLTGAMVRQWNSFNPTVDILAFGGDAASPSLDNITAVGLYYSPGPGFTEASLFISEAYVDIPESKGAIGMLGLAALFMVMGLRPSRKNKTSQLELAE